MTLGEWFCGLDRDQYVRIATKDGSRFILAGTYGAVIQEIPELDRKYKENAHENMIRKEEMYIYRATQDTRRMDSKERKAHESFVRNLGTQYLKAILNYKTFKPLLERTVIDDFIAAPCIDDVNEKVYVAYVTGTEIGEYEKINSCGVGDVME